MGNKNKLGERKAIINSVESEGADLKNEPFAQPFCGFPCCPDVGK